MSFEILTIPSFDRQIKKLAKKYPSLKADLFLLGNRLQQTPTMGTSLGNDCYKIRLTISSKGKGKRSGGRVITCFIDGKKVYLLSIYDKSEIDSISEKKLTQLLKKI